MKLIKTVRCKLEVNAETAPILLETLEKFAHACNDILRISQENGTTNKVRLQHLCYYEIKERYGLVANMVIRAIARVAEASKKKRMHSRPRTFKPTSMSLDRDLFRFIEKTESVSLATVQGRVKLRLDIGNFQRGLLAGQKPTAGALYYNRRTKEFYINIVVNREVPFPPKSGNVIGIDRGVYNLASASNGLNFSGRQAMHVRKHYGKLRQSLQAKGTRGAKRTLRRLSGKERRWMADLNHRISKAIVASCAPGDTIAMENLKHIRSRIRVARKQRQIQHSWAFGQLGSFIEYKAAERGIAVAEVDPRHTSQRCPMCGFASRNNRRSHQFKCSSCNHTANADLNAAVNIRQVYLNTLADGPSSTGPEVATACG